MAVASGLEIPTLAGWLKDCGQQAQPLQVDL